MAIWSWLAEQRIQEAMQRGEFDHLEGSGKPLELEDLSRVPEELRMSYKILKNAGMLPEEVTLRADCVSLEELIAACLNGGQEHSEERQRLEKTLTLKKLRLQELLRSRGLDNVSAYSEYGDSLRHRIT